MRDGQLSASGTGQELIVNPGHELVAETFCESTVR
jgi:ABC-type proline/glycine betaine transport system ATPase subunit